MNILQKTADFISGVDKMKSAVYNASYTAGSHLLTQLFFEGNSMHHYIGFLKTGVIVFIRAA